MFFDYFHNLPLPTSSLSRLCHPRDGVAVGMLESWREHGGDPLVIHGASSATSALHGQLQELGLGVTLVHGIPFEQSTLGAHGFFAFVSLRSPPGARESAIASMAVPQLFSTYCRALSRDRTPTIVHEDATDGTLSEREVEILHWVREGKSNHEIGMVLSISPLTVKNHIQRILKKLQASNRTQAVSKAINMRLLSGGAPPRQWKEVPAELRADRTLGGEIAHT
jgi:transcriptional regulator EpsA